MEVETIGRRLRRLRLAANLSQRELSERGVSYAYISRIEAGTRNPSVKTLRMLAPKLGVSVEYLETGQDSTTTDDLARVLLERVHESLSLVIDESGVTLMWGDCGFSAETPTLALRAGLGYLDRMQQLAEEAERIEREQREIEGAVSERAVQVEAERRALAESAALAAGPSS